MFEAWLVNNESCNQKVLSWREQCNSGWGIRRRWRGSLPNPKINSALYLQSHNKRGAKKWDMLSSLDPVSGKDGKSCLVVEDGDHSWLRVCETLFKTAPRELWGNASNVSMYKEKGDYKAIPQLQKVIQVKILFGERSFEGVNQVWFGCTSIETKEELWEISVKQ